MTASHGIMTASHGIMTASHDEDASRCSSPYAARSETVAHTDPLAVDAHRRLAFRAAYATPHASVDGEGARVARQSARSAPRVAHGARRRARVAGCRTRDARLAVDGACRVPRRA